VIQLKKFMLVLSNHIKQTKLGGAKAAAIEPSLIASPKSSFEASASDDKPGKAGRRQLQLQAVVEHQPSPSDIEIMEELDRKGSIPSFVPSEHNHWFEKSDSYRYFTAQVDYLKRNSRSDGWKCRNPLYDF
jgi:hypothetical protein